MTINLSPAAHARIESAAKSILDSVFNDANDSAISIASDFCVSADDSDDDILLMTIELMILRRVRTMISANS